MFRFSRKVDFCKRGGAERTNIEPLARGISVLDEGHRCIRDLQSSQQS